MTRPSTLYHVKPAWVALCFDRGVDLFGRLLEDAVRSAAEQGGGKKEDGKAAERRGRRVLERWLASADPEDAPRPSGFRDPFAEGLVVRTVTGA